MKATQICKLFSILTILFFFPKTLVATTIDSFTEAGTYPIVLTDEYGRETKTIYVTILYPRTIVASDNCVAIYAYGVYIPGNTFITLTDEDLIQITKARV